MHADVKCVKLEGRGGIPVSTGVVSPDSYIDKHASFDANIQK